MGKTKERFQIDIWRDDDYWIAQVWINGHSYYTQGRNYEEIWEMVGDLVLTVKDVRVNWWNKFLYKFFKY